MNEDELEVKKVKKDEILYRQGEKDSTLYKVISGKFLIFYAKGSRIDPLMTCGPGKFLGAGSFFLQSEKILYTVAMEDSTVKVILAEELKKNFPPWLANIARSITGKILNNLNLITNIGIKRKGELISPLTMDEQRHYFSLIK